jgi:anthranilate phosphoribosyltransferase
MLRVGADDKPFRQPTTLLRYTSAMAEEHPFAPYLRIIAKGPNLSRPLTAEEMLEAARMILSGKVEPVQLGAFLCILRIRTEVPEEGAGFVRAVRESIVRPAGAPPVDLDWASYAGKKRQLPWYLLAALSLAQNGVRLCMHGTEGHTPGRVYSREALASLGIPAAGSMAEAAEQIRRANFAFLPLSVMSPRLQELIDLKSVIGVRSPVNTFVRQANPFGAPHTLLSVVHPPYRSIHRDTARLVGQPHVAVLKGEGGEVEVRPTKPVEVQFLHEGVDSDETWPVLLDGVAEKDDAMDLNRLGAVWRGEADDAYGRSAIIGTMAVALRLMKRAGSPAEALAQAEGLWKDRNRQRILAAA